VQVKAIMLLATLGGVAWADEPPPATVTTPGASVAPTNATPVPAPPEAVAPELVTGVEVPDNAAPDHTVGRAVLFPFRLLTEALVAPLQGGAYLLERYQLVERIKGLLFTEDGDLGWYPTAFIETHLGLNVGLHVVESNLFGHGEHVSLGVGYGGQYEQTYDAKITTGMLLDRVTFGVRATYQVYDRSDFFGIGNGHLSGVPTMPIDALGDDTAVATRFGQHVTHGELYGSGQVIGPLSLGAAVALTRRTFENHADLQGTFAPTTDVYTPMSLVGFETGANNAYGEISAIVDTRDVASRYISRAAPSTGWWATGYVGVTRGRDQDPSHYTRYGVDVRRYIDLYHGDRVLVLRGYLEGVTAQLDQIPFTDLPRLGGNEVLRAFEIDRFRDRVVAMASVEYDFPVHYGVNAYGFVDGGRVANDIGGLDPNDLHYGWGLGLQVQSLNAFLLRAQFAHSTDGTFLRLAVDPIADQRAKKRRL
jgi:outer membrane protein assembly factor BamA